MQDSARLREALNSLPEISNDIGPRRGAVSSMQLTSIPAALGSLFGLWGAPKHGMSTSTSLNSLAGAKQRAVAASAVGDAFAQAPHLLSKQRLLLREFQVLFRS